MFQIIFAGEKERDFIPGPDLQGTAVVFMMFFVMKAGGKDLKGLFGKSAGRIREDTDRGKRRKEEKIWRKAERYI